MPVQLTDLLLIERSGDLHKATVNEVAALAGSPLSGAFTVTLPNGSGVLDWEETIVATGLVATDRVVLWPQPGTSDDENGATMLDLSSAVAVPDTDSLLVTLTFSVPTSGPVKMYWRTV